MMRSRIATAAVAAALVAGLGACSSTSKGASGGAPTAAGTSAGATVPGGDPTSAPSAADSASSTSDASGGFTDAQLETMRAKVAAAYGQGFTAPPHYEPMTPDQKELAADFDSATTMTALWGSGGTGSDRLMDCGTAKYDGVVIGAVQGSGGTATVPVTLYQGEKAGNREITVTVDSGAGVIKGVSCGTPKDADFPGVAPIATYYGATATMDNAVLNDKSKSYFTPAFTAWKPADADYNKETCTQDVPDFWIVALTGTNSAASAWDFEPGPVKTVADPAAPNTTGFNDSVAVDLGSSKISRVTCFAKPPTAGNAHPADYSSALMEYYRTAADQASLGVDAKAAIQPYFVSDAAFTAAWSATGPVPLLCANKVPGAVQIATGTTPTAAGSTTTVKMVTWPNWHPDQPGQELSKFTLTLDTSTLKIASITCTK